ncbi:hypothetical protein FEM48_Zijuj04G0048500 [Ziziphus jujuba var. spinosa]|uniref:Phytocyanin domain-containing protein n=1 Tax=Ziziphus jujuba var. spinosa TaxID=714518 RepID=A0A978VHW8_ZIZJJ|nr:hypothetical protein FEM48_Zijuj04G0048500 [Ziziphus jujuba var. spinosa]
MLMQMQGPVMGGRGGWTVVIVMMMMMMMTCTVGSLVKVGGANGWNQNVNYTQWSAHQHVYVGDWLYFVFDKRYYNVLEVNKTSYEKCNDKGFITNITRGGRDVYEVKEARPYYFLSSGGYCYHGMRVCVMVQQLPPPPASAPAQNAASYHILMAANVFSPIFLLSMALVWATSCSL